MEQRLGGWRFETSGGVSKTPSQAGHQWLTPVILAPQEAEIRRIKVLTHPFEPLN
jgi:hypothetical protein